MRTELINNDVNLFLSQEPDEFLRVIKKRIKTWQTATDYSGLDFIALVLNTVSEKPSLIPVHTIWSDIFEKLDNVNFDFKSSHYLPSFDLGTVYRPNMRSHYKAMVQQLVDRNIIFDAALIEHFVNQQVDGIDESVAVILRTLSPVFDNILMKHNIKREIHFMVSDLYEMSLLENPSVETQMTNDAITLTVNSFMAFGGPSLKSEVDNYLYEQSKKIDFILSYVDTAILSQDDAKDLLRCFRPSGEVMNNLDNIHRKRTGTHWFNYMALFENGSLLPRNYFTKQQIEVMDKIQDKFNVQLLEAKNV